MTIARFVSYALPVLLIVLPLTAGAATVEEKWLKQVNKVARNAGSDVKELEKVVRAAKRTCGCDGEIGVMTSNSVVAPGPENVVCVIPSFVDGELAGGFFCNEDWLPIP